MPRFQKISPISLAFSLLFLLSVCSFYPDGRAQNKGHVLVDGNVYVNNRPVSSVDIKVYLKDQEIKHTRSVNNGAFQFILPFYQKYRIEIGKPGLVTKKFILNTEIPDSEREDQIYIFPLQLDLFPPFEEVDMSILEEPMAYISFDKLVGTFGFDISQAEERVRRVQAVQNEIRNILEVKAKLFNLEFNNAEIAYKQKNYKLALDDYQKALRVYPPASASLYIDLSYINNRIKSLERMLEERESKEKAKSIKKAYDNAIAKADKAFERKYYDEAIETYTQAMALNPEESHPRKRVAKINEIVSKNIVLTLSGYPPQLKQGEEAKISFTPIRPHLKKGNYLIIKLKATDPVNGKLFVKFGNQRETGGGFVLKEVPVDAFTDRYIRIGGSDKWFRMDANWISLYAEGCDFEIEEIRLTRTE